MVEEILFVVRSVLQAVISSMHTRKQLQAKFMRAGWRQVRQSWEDWRAERRMVENTVVIPTWRGDGVPIDQGGR